MEMKWNEKSQKHLKTALQCVYVVSAVSLVCDFFISLSFALHRHRLCTFSFSCLLTIFIKRMKFMSSVCVNFRTWSAAALALSLLTLSAWCVQSVLAYIRFPSETGYILLLCKKAHTFCQVKPQYMAHMMIVTYRTRCDVWDWSIHFCCSLNCK